MLVRVGEKRVMLCDCEATMPLDAEALARALGTETPAIATSLCRRQQARLAGEAPGIVACAQERAVFEEALTEAAGHAAAESLVTVDIRARAAWSKEAAEATPKIAALLAEAALPVPETHVVTLESGGVTLVYGRDEVAIEAGAQLGDRLDVTVLLTRPGDVTPPARTTFPVLQGTIRTARGHLGAFELVVDDYALPAPSSRRRLRFGPARNEAVSNCDIILDLTGGTPLFPSPRTRPGYLHADPADPVAVQKALLAATDLVGTFDKPRHVAYRPELCAHSRNRTVGCSRCLEVCPTGAITPNGDHVAIDAAICAGCGGCHAVCPTGAASYAYPPAEHLLERVRTLLTTYHAAGGTDAVLLLHDAEHGAALIDLLARVGDGLPARVMPVAVNEITQLGIELLAGAMAMGAADIRILATGRRRPDLTPLARVMGLAEASLAGLGYGTGRVQLVEADDPDSLGEELWQLERRPGTAMPASFLPMGDKLGLMKLALRQLHAAAPEPVDVIRLPPGAPFGRVRIDTAGCTLCLACTGVCPTGALAADPDHPRLSFTENACVQCGLCKPTCPEKVIELVPQLDFTEAAFRAETVKEEEPALCTRCGKPFGVKSTIDRVAAKLAGRHWMYQGDTSQIERLGMCADCRVIAQSEHALDPYAGPERPRTKGAEDYRG
jgi:ferredoxin